MQRLLLLAVALFTLASVAGCERVGGDDNVARDINIDGSSTVATLTGAVATDFNEDHPHIAVSTNISGTGGGFKRFVRGDTDISNASRPIMAPELETANSNRVEFIEIPVAIDGITFAVHPGNDWVDHLTMDEVLAIFSADGGVRTWADLRPGWPDKEIALYIPGKDSGTYDFFKEVVFAYGQPARQDASITESESDNTLVRGVQGDVHALGYFGFAYYVMNQDKIRAVPIVNPKGEKVTPSLDTIASGDYAPFSRPLYIYVNARSAGKEAVQTFVDYYLDNAMRLAPIAGYAPLTESQYRVAKEIWSERRTGTVWLDGRGEHVQGSIDEVYGR